VDAYYDKITDAELLSKWHGMGSRTSKCAQIVTSDDLLASLVREKRVAIALSLLKYSPSVSSETNP
jgi:hypothetical protein